LAMAGGLTPYAKGRVIVLRDNRESKDKGGGPDQRYEINIGAIVSGKRPQDNIILQPGDTLIFP
ncbi:MAG: hypothetical protein ACJ759_02245, partial [Thermoanaerobaculia bacterium]